MSRPEGGLRETAQLRSLKARRAQIKAKCTRFSSYVEELEVQNTSVAELRQRLQRFTETWDHFNEIQAAIEEIQADSEEVISEEEERNSFEEKYFAIASRLEMLIEDKIRPIHTANVNMVPRDIREGTPATMGSVPSNEHLKLPRVNLPTFSGPFEEWMPFRNMFQSMIDQNPALPNIQKMQYLILALKGEARDVIGSLEVSEENYAEAWAMLKERYDDSGLIIQKHVKALFEIPVMIKENHLSLRRLLDIVLKHLRALKALKRPTEHWDDLMVHLITSRLDQKTSRAWEISLKRGQIPALKQLTEFLAQHCKALEASYRTTRSGVSGASHEKYGQSKGTSANLTTANKCGYCGKGHSIYNCEDYLRLEIHKRIKEARARNLCLNCLKSTAHIAKGCTIKPCRECNKQHNTLLHLESTKKSDSTLEDVNNSVKDKVVATSVSHVSPETNKYALLATAIVVIADSKGNDTHCRALLDSGSQSCFITRNCVERLRLTQFDTHTPVCGLGGMSTQTRKRVDITLRSRINKFRANLSCLVIDEITQALPANRIRANEVRVPKGIQLADPEFYKSSRVDLLIGAEIFFDLMCVGRIKKSETQPTWQKTLLGWIASGKLVATDYGKKKTVCGLIVNEQLKAELTRFWQIEHGERQNTRSPEERACEAHFKRTYRRTEEGRFVVMLPTRENQLQDLGKSRELAIQRLEKLEGRLEKRPQLKKEYTEFIHEYLELKHMKEVKDCKPRQNSQQQYYLPHHCVVKETSATTKLRVVFDASSKTTSGISLNDALMVGPVLQQDLFSILLRFRRFKHALTADIAKMYRQVLVAEEQTSLQRIVWRDNPVEEIKVYELLTLTYGTAPASFLATRAIHELADLEENNFPLGAEIARRDLYMDDLITGADSIKEAEMIRDQVATLLLKGGFPLRKWASNHQELLRSISEQIADNNLFELDKGEVAKTLGVKWNRVKDAFQYSIEIENVKVCTKRGMLSGIARIFDPLGLLAPVIITAKIWIQDLWKLQLNWDESLPADVASKWTNYVSDMHQLNDFSVRRNVRGDDLDSEIQIHGFCDASERAYGAGVYMRSFNKNGSVQTRLLCAKSRVAPVKTVSIPRLELCGAQLLSQLVNRVKNSLNLGIDRLYYWTDSLIVLHWIKATNKKLPVFVAHRVGEIQELTKQEEWGHVRTGENPADLVSRGCTSQELYSSQLWWNGPAWLADQAQIDERSRFKDTEDSSLEHQGEQVTLVIARSPEDNLINRFSNFTRLIQVTARCIKFAQLCKDKGRAKIAQDLTLEELKHASRCLVRMEQRFAFEEEIGALQSKKAIPRRSSLRHLNPWLDQMGLLRVGGRLRHAVLEHDTKYPLVLPHKSKLTELIVLHEHVRHQHAGVEATLAAVRKLYWPIRARGIVRKLIYKCIRCFRAKPRMSEQIMGALPVDRVTPGRPFANTGVDFCGPIYIREGRRRGAKRIKAYVAVFVCMAVKAVHLEVVSDMTTDAFLNAFKRFISRRGRPTNMYSDNGTNFVGANRELENCRKLFAEEQRREIIDCTISEGIKWNFIPARAPHFGGLWEAAVKSFKNHFYKTTVDAAMTFEEASTLVSQIEAILNSRPLTGLSEDPNDLNFLSPGHFLIGETLTSYPELDLADVRVNRLSRWQMLERMRQHFWKRWSSEYLLTLQRRNKWLKEIGPQIKTGQLVICREDGLPPLKWALARVQSVLPGSDGVTRTAIIKTAVGEYKRPAAKLCVLPIEDYMDCN